MIERMTFIVDGEECPLDRVPNEALTILKNQSEQALLATNQTRSLIKKISIGSGVLAFIGNAITFLSRNPILTLAGVITSIAGCLTVLKMFKKDDVQLKIKHGLKKLDTDLGNEIKERDFIKKAFPDCFDRELLKPVQFCEVYEEIEN